MSTKAIFRAVEMKGDGTDPDFIDFGRIENSGNILVSVQETPPLSTSGPVGIRPLMSLDGENFIEGHQFSPFAPSVQSRIIVQSVSGVTFIRFPLGKYKTEGYVGKLSATVSLS